MDYGVTEQGFVMKRFDTILEELQTEISEDIGFDVSQNPQSALNAAIIMPLAQELARMWEVAQDTYYSMFIGTADGINLDNAAQYGAVQREPNRKTRYPIHATCTEGAIITAGSIIASNTNPVVQLTAINTVNTTRRQCNSLKIKPSAVEQAVYAISINGTSYTYSASGTDTAADIMAGILDAITDTGYTCTIDEEVPSVLEIVDNTITRNNVIELTNNLTTEDITVLVYYDTVDYGAISLPNGSIDTIVTNITGLKSIVNKVEPTLGRIQETDAEYRKSYTAKANSRANSVSQAISSYILQNITGVESVQVFVNESDEVDTDGRTPHSIEVVVKGGNDTEIAKAIFNEKAGGIATYGTTTVNIMTDYDESVDVKFSRPTPKYIWIKIEITAAGNMPSNYADIVKKSILASVADFNTGDDVLYQNFYSNVYDEIENATLATVQLAVTDSESETPTYDEDNITIEIREYADFSYDRIEVTAT